MDKKDETESQNHLGNVNTETSQLTEDEKKELELLRKREEQRKAKPFNIYDRINVSPKTLSIVIVVGILVIIGAIVLGILAK